jgi:hypothetical protein
MQVQGEVSIDEVMAILRPFGSSPLVVKDFVKSQKHYWHEACYIPSASDRQAVERVVRAFLDLQGDDLNEGLVFREYEQLEPLATHPQSGMPLALEYRTFWLDGEPVLVGEYWAEGAYSGTPPPVGEFREVAAAVQSRFFTMDIARRAAGDWIIVELGDGQVSALPENVDPDQFYRSLLARWPVT